jgi:hypothetical protein
MRTPRALLAFIPLLLSSGAVRVAAQDAPRFASLSAERVTLLPAQEWTGSAGSRALLDAFDRTLSAYLADGGIADGWTYPADVLRAARGNPTYVSNPLALGTQPLKSEKAREGTPLSEPFQSRLRAILALSGGRHAVVPVAIRVDTTQVPALAELRLTLVDGRQSRVLWTAILETRFDGAMTAAVDSLAARTAALFVVR